MWGAWRELRRLPNALYADEVVDDVAACSFGETGGRAIMVATNERLLFVKDGWIFKNSQNIAYNAVKGVEIRTHLIFADIVFVGEGHEIVVKKVGRFAAKHFVDLVRSRIGSRYNKWQRDEHEKRQQAATASNASSASASNPLAFDTASAAPAPATGSIPLPSTAPDSFLNKMERLAHLRAAGNLTEAEFQDAKRRLLENY